MDGRNDPHRKHLLLFLSELSPSQLQHKPSFANIRSSAKGQDCRSHKPRQMLRQTLARASRGEQMGAGWRPECRQNGSGSPPVKMPACAQRAAIRLWSLCRTRRQSRLFVAPVAILLTSSPRQARSICGLCRAVGVAHFDSVCSENYLEWICTPQVSNGVYRSLSPTTRKQT